MKKIIRLKLGLPDFIECGDDGKCIATYADLTNPQHIDLNQLITEVEIVLRELHSLNVD